MCATVWTGKRYMKHINVTVRPCNWSCSIVGKRARNTIYLMRENRYAHVVQRNVLCAFRCVRIVRRIANDPNDIFRARDLPADNIGARESDWVLFFFKNIVFFFCFCIRATLIVTTEAIEQRAFSRLYTVTIKCVWQFYIKWLKLVDDQPFNYAVYGHDACKMPSSSTVRLRNFRRFPAFVLIKRQNVQNV